MAIVEAKTHIERFTARSERLGARVHRVANEPTAVAGAVLATLREVEAGSAFVADDLGAERAAIVEAIERAGIALLRGSTPAEFEPAEVGISRAAFGVAETGSLGIIGNALQPRLASMLPMVHIALVDASRIYSSLDEAGAHLERVMAVGGAEGVRYATFVTGPSRTADVEKTLAVGVHGPRLVHVILIDDQR